MIASAKAPFTGLPELTASSATPFQSTPRTKVPANTTQTAVVSFPKSSRYLFSRTT